MSGTCPIQVTLHGYWIDCTFPAGHDPWLHSWQTPSEPGPFVMAPPASEVRNRDGGPLGYPYDPAAVTLLEGKAAVLHSAQRWAAEAGMALVDPEDLRWVMGLEPLNTTTVARAQAAHDRLFAIAAGVKP